MTVDASVHNGHGSSEMALITRYFPGLNETQKNCFIHLKELYSYWNERINVISRKDIDQLMLHHVLHSLSIAKIISFQPGTKIIDVGTGGGFPGIPLAILFSESEFLLVDSIGKKITVVSEIVSALKLSNVTAVKSRAENIQSPCDFIVSRAVTTIAEQYNWTKHLVSKGGSNSLRNGWLLLKGGDLESEVSAANRAVQMFEIKNFFEEDFFETKKVVYLSA